MKTKFDSDKRMQLLVGSACRCTKEVPADTLMAMQPKNGFRNDFSKGSTYKVKYANTLIGDNGGGHTFSIEYFRLHFVECKP